MTDLFALPRAELESRFDVEYRRAYTAWLLGHRSKNTRDCYRRNVELWRRWCVDHGESPLEPGRPLCQVWVAEQVADGVAAATVRQRVAAVRSWMEMLIVEALRSNTSPWAGVRLPRVDDVSSTVPLADWEVARLILHAPTVGPRAVTVVLMLATMGLRAGEVAAVGAGQVADSPYGLFATIVRKGGRRGMVAIPAQVAAAAAVSGWPGDWVKGWKLRTQAEVGTSDRFTVSKLVADVCEVAQIHVHPHQFRHWFVTTALEDGVKLDRVQAAVGHRDPATTLRYAEGRNLLVDHPAHVVAKHVDGFGLPVS